MATIDGQSFLDPGYFAGAVFRLSPSRLEIGAEPGCMRAAHTRLSMQLGVDLDLPAASCRLDGREDHSQALQIVVALTHRRISRLQGV
jgi:hypothetical protein